MTTAHARFTGLALALCCLATGPAAGEAATDAAVAELRETISKIVDTQSQSSRERSDWSARKDQMAALLELHRRELALLDEELEQAGQSAGPYDETREEVQAELERLRASRRLAAEAVARNTPRMLALAARFPAPLAQETAAERLGLESWQAGDEPREALQAILGLLAKAEQFNRRITRTQEVRDGREVEVVYLGLARAFFADRSGNAGVGEPAADGWNWTARPEIHAEVTKAFATLDKRRPPQLVELPLQIR